jgi:hypothetical protein
MEILEDYSQMFGILDKWPKEKFESEVEIYSKTYFEVLNKIEKLKKYAFALSKNIDWFNRKLNDFYFNELEKNFVLKPEHKLIIQHLNFDESKGSPVKLQNNYNLYDKYLQLIFKLDPNDLSENQQQEYKQLFEKLIDEIPFAIKKLSE